MLVNAITDEIKNRFWNKISIVLDDDGCWEWTGARIKDGYGQMRLPGAKHMLAHRCSWTIHYGEIPEGMEVCHKCDNPPCVNPFHLFPGTHSDNMRDMEAKGRGNKATGDRNGSRLYPERRPRGDNHPFRKNPSLAPRGDRNGARLHPETRARGERSGSAKLTESNVAEIRKHIAEGKLSYPAIGRIYGVSKTAIRSIALGKTWKL